MSDETNPVPDEGTGPLPTPSNELTVLSDGIAYLTDGTGRLIVLPYKRAVTAVTNVLASQADRSNKPL